MVLRLRTAENWTFPGGFWQASIISTSPVLPHPNLSTGCSQSSMPRMRAPRPGLGRCLSKEDTPDLNHILPVLHPALWSLLPMTPRWLMRTETYIVNGGNEQQRQNYDVEDDDEGKNHQHVHRAVKAEGAAGKSREG